MRLVIALILLFTVPARAELQVCNKADVDARVALGQYNGTAWESKGWWTIPSRKCETLVPGRLNARFYYLFGTDDASGTWNGGTYFCTTQAPEFRIAGRGNCAARGYDRKGFFAIDTGSRPSWTQTLSD